LSYPANRQTDRQTD